MTEQEFIIQFLLTALKNSDYWNSGAIIAEARRAWGLIR